MKMYCLKILLLLSPFSLFCQTANLCERSSKHSIFLRSVQQYGGSSKWEIKRASEEGSTPEQLSAVASDTKGWLPAIVPGTVLNTLVANNKYPEPYFGDNNRKKKKLIPDIADVGKDYYTYWFRTSFGIPATFSGKRIWVKLHGVNYRSEIWLNGKKIGTTAGMFAEGLFDITAAARLKGKNILAIKVSPIDFTGSSNRPIQDRPGAIGENGNGGDGEIGKNVTMLMSVGWDFTAPDGIRDRNTGIWRDVELFATGEVRLEHPFVTTRLPLPDTTSADETISVELINATGKKQGGSLQAAITSGVAITIQKYITLNPFERKTVTLSSKEFTQLRIRNPKLWWPLNKGNQHLYQLKLSFVQNRVTSHSLETSFGVREISSDQHTPNSSRRFLVNGHPVFIRGSNWVPEAMLRNTEERTYAELRYTKQAGINLLRLWGGGITESDYFYKLCDQMGILVWSEFWITGDTRFPVDTALYFQNLKASIKRIRNHACSAYYVSANESTEIAGAGILINSIDPTKGYQPQSECCGIHDGSPYKYENPMQYFENTASARGSRVDGFNPEYGAPVLPILSSLKKLMPKEDLWPINKKVWDYLDGGGFHQMTTKYNTAVEAFGIPKSIEEYAKKAQFVGAMNYRSIWEVWNSNKFGLGDRYSTGLLFWYHNSPLPQTASRFYDWFLEPTAGLYYSQNALEPLHAQYDYLKNTVSVYNDYRKSFSGYRLIARIYDFDSKLVFERTAIMDIPSDGLVKDAFKLSLPEGISQIHFIKLILENASGRQIADSFYWRSNDAYEGAWTMTGPATSGFQKIYGLRKTILSSNVSQVIERDKKILIAKVKNTGNSIAFFTQIRLSDAIGDPISPAYYSDNFFNLLPGEEKTVRIEIPVQRVNKQHPINLHIDAFNAPESSYSF